MTYVRDFASDTRPLSSLTRGELEALVSWLRKDKSRIWSANLEGMRKLEHAQREIKELKDGSCRYNCRTAKACFAQGVEWAIGFLPDGWEDEYRKLKDEDK